jgi:hypothetical protein
MLCHFYIVKSEHFLEVSTRPGRSTHVYFRAHIGCWTALIDEVKLAASFGWPDHDYGCSLGENPVLGKLKKGKGWPPYYFVKVKVTA